MGTSNENSSKKRWRPQFLVVFSLVAVASLYGMKTQLTGQAAGGEDTAVGCGGEVAQLDLASVRTGDVFHGHVVVITDGTDIKDMRDVGVAQLHNHPRLIDKPAEVFLFLRHIGAQLLEDTEAIVAFNAARFGEVDLPHPSVRKRTQQ